MIAWGGFTGAVIALGFLLHFALFFWLFGVILASGLTGFARQKTGAHTPFEIYSGYLIGLAVMTALFFTLS